MTSSKIHPTAIIDPTAIVGEGVEIGPFCVIGPEVSLGANTILGPHVVIEARTILGEGCHVSSGAVVGGEPQDLSYQGEPTRVRIGNNTRIRECVTVNRATGEGNETVVGDNCFLMAYSHLAHNCLVGDHVILANNAQIGGHVQIGDYVFLGGSSVVHQHCRIGRMAFLSGTGGTRQDLAPFSMNDGCPSDTVGINSVGLKRRGLNTQERQNIRKAFYYLWFSNLNQTQALEAIRENLTQDAYIQELVEFVQTSKRGIARSKAMRRGEHLETPDPVSV